MNESELVRRLKAGDAEAFADLLDRYGAKIFNLVFRSVNPREEAEDVAQEVFVEVWRGIGGFRGDARLSTWIHRVALNVCLEHNRRHHPEMISLDDADESIAPDLPDDWLEKAELKDRVDAALDALPFAQRQVVVLHELQGLTYGEVAQVLGVPVGTVKSRLHHAFCRLRELLGPYVNEMVDG
jgi:RNA polymerase sigma-70 factor (ECF subfamily)